MDVTKTDEEWREQLSAEQYEVLRKHGTERAFSGKYVDCKDDGMYRCAACGNELFDSATKFDSGTGWPSFWEEVRPGAIERRVDRSYGMARTEILCARCGSHLGHVFNDGPRPTGDRYCMNSLALELDPRAGDDDE